MAKYKIPLPKPMFVLNGTEFSELNKQIKDIEKEFRVKEIDITFKEERLIYSTIKSSEDAYKLVKEVISEGMEIQEHFVVIYLNLANKVIGYYKHSKGTINSTLVDVEMIVAVGLKILAKNVILCHNHPSGDVKPTQKDKNLTHRIKDAFKYFDISVLDHIIASRNDYYSFADSYESSFLSGYKKTKASRIEDELREEIFQQLKKVTRANSPHVWEQIQTQAGYLKMEEKIIYKVIYDHMVPAAVIPQIEMELD